MNPDDIRPGDVYPLVQWIIRVLYGLCAVSVVLVAVVVWAGLRITRVLRRVETLLDIVEKHAEITDRQQERVKADTLLAADLANLAMEKIPEKVVQKLRSNGVDPVGEAAPPALTVSATIDGTILDVSPAAAALFLYERSELIGQNVRILIPERYLAGHEEGMRKIRDAAVPPWSQRVITGHGRKRDGSEEAVNVTLTWYAVEMGQVVITATIRRTNAELPVEGKT